MSYTLNPTITKYNYSIKYKLIEYNSLDNQIRQYRSIINILVFISISFWIIPLISCLFFVLSIRSTSTLGLLLYHLIFYKQHLRDNCYEKVTDTFSHSILSVYFRQHRISSIRRNRHAYSISPTLSNANSLVLEEAMIWE